MEEEPIYAKPNKNFNCKNRLFEDCERDNQCKQDDNTFTCQPKIYTGRYNDDDDDDEDLPAPPIDDIRRLKPGPPIYRGSKPSLGGRKKSKSKRRHTKRGGRKTKRSGSKRRGSKRRGSKRRGRKTKRS